MTRFNITLEQGVNFVHWSVINNFGGEIFIPKLSGYRIIDVARAISNELKFKFIGIRKGEKMYMKNFFPLQTVLTQWKVKVFM